MTLTALRRLVMSGTLLSLGAAGGAAWFSFQAKASPRPAEEWPKLFPVKAGSGVDLGAKGPGPLPEYVEATKWPQGELPPKVDPAAAKVEAPKVDPFESKYRLNWVQVGALVEDCFAQLKIGAGEAFSIGVGGRIPEVPEDPKSDAMTLWRLIGVSEGGGGKPASASFRNLDTLEVKTLSAVLAPVKDFTKDMQGGNDIGGAEDSVVGKPDRKRRLQVVPVKEDHEKGEYEYRIPEEDGVWLDAYSDEEAAKLGVQGGPDGIVLKAVPVNSRAYDLGFRSEDRVISVNGEKVTSTEDALAKGRRQHAEGASTFEIRGIRKGKEVKYTFHATRKGGDRGGRGGGGRK
ncbi:MAG: hypothetical protein HUU06_09940 [Planctomycetaceae bacterium]|nr:hypothetical protein [Planctomycetota bacterium]NUN53089.1 hypothetical protein [Planctomycetaceae bacterium]